MMKYKNIVIFTKTLWNEPPRLRHQLTKLLFSHRHKITFFEKTSLNTLKTVKYAKNGINFIRHYELLHHQLKPFKWLIAINKIIVKYFINKSIKENDIDLVINFNYDYDFLKELFPDTKIVTIINDDFVAQAKSWMKNSIQKQLKSTCEESDVVLTVSYPLENQIKKYNKNTHIFFPWAEQKYIAPADTGTIRDVVLFWGYVDHRIDWKVIEYLLKKEVKIRFIGNIQSNIKEKIEIFSKYDNFEILPSMYINKINFDYICCSILPYDLKVKGVEAISISNRAFQLLSYGIPLVYSNLQYLIKAPSNAIDKCKSNEDYKKTIEYFKNNFNLCQSDIEIFLTEHYAEERYKFFMEKI